MGTKVIKAYRVSEYHQASGQRTVLLYLTLVRSLISPCPPFRSLQTFDGSESYGHLWYGLDDSLAMPAGLVKDQIPAKIIIIYILLEFVFEQIIPTQQAYSNLAQFDWSRANSKRHLYFDKSTEQESWNFFLCVDF